MSLLRAIRLLPLLFGLGLAGGALAAAPPATPATGSPPPVASPPVQPVRARPSRAQIDAFRLQVLRALPPAGAAAGRCLAARYPDPAPRTVNCATPLPRPYTVGAGTDGFASVKSGHYITAATGSFPGVSVQKEKGAIQDTGVVADNTYSLQLNTNRFKTPACGSVKNCIGWAQFVYSSDSCGGEACIFMQYWLLNYPSPCPSGAPWNYYAGTPTTGAGCFVNSPATILTQPTWAEFSGFRFEGYTNTANNGVLVSTIDGDVFIVGNPDILSLTGKWTALEFNLVGDCCATQADFYNGNSTLSVHADLETNSPTSIKCVDHAALGATAETNNLTIVRTCNVNGEEIDFTESGGVPVPPTPLTCSQVQRAISGLERKIALETSSKTSCPGGIVAICTQTLKTDQAALIALRAQLKTCKNQ